MTLGKPQAPSVRSGAGPVTQSAGTLRGGGQPRGAAHSGTQLTVGVSASGFAPGMGLKLRSPLLALSPLKFPGSQRNKPAVCGPPPPTSGQQLPPGHSGVAGRARWSLRPACWPLRGARGDSGPGDALPWLVVERLAALGGVGGLRGSEETGGKQGVAGGPGRRWGSVLSAGQARHEAEPGQHRTGLSVGSPSVPRSPRLPLRICWVPPTADTPPRLRPASSPASGPAGLGSPPLSPGVTSGARLGCQAPRAS